MFARRVEAAERFIDAAAIVCDEAKRLGARGTWIGLRFVHGSIALAVASPDFAEPADLTVPLVGNDGELGAIAWTIAEPPSRALERALMLVATQLAVWCTRRGVGAVPRRRPGGALGPRQLQVARLAARGQSNAAIGKELAISINTVKARLKEVFERLGVRNRTELAHAMLRRAPLDGIAPGITRLSTVTVIRAHDM
ncbi:MAG TPA: helix-turn-helix transcriptional regulator [Kofleriaceae bacterium]|nr:helix-turn-helix transcriptional regulator [Kofleriaceae bacterium]